MAAELFLELLGRHGTDFEQIAAAMPHKVRFQVLTPVWSPLNLVSQTAAQVCNFYNANCEEMGLKEIASRENQDTKKNASPPMASLAPNGQFAPAEQFVPYLYPPHAPPMYHHPMGQPPGPMYGPHPAMFMSSYGPVYPPYYILPPPSNDPTNTRSSKAVPSKAS